MNSFGRVLHHQPGQPVIFPHKDINRPHFGQGNAGAGFPGVLEHSPERVQECQLAVRDLILPYLTQVK